MSIVKTLAVVTVVGVVGLTALSASDYKDRGNGVKSEMMKKHFAKKRDKMRNILKKLDLTTDQRDKLKQNRKAMRNDMKMNRKSMKGSKDITQFITSEGFNKSAYVEQSVVRAKTRATNRADMFEGTLSILTSEQKAKFVELLKEDKK